MDTKKNGNYLEALRGEWAKPMKRTKEEEQGKRPCRTALSKCMSSRAMFEESVQ
jgi:hypothetical protein